MPYYLAPYIGSGRSSDAFRPRGSDQPGWSAIDLRPDGSIIAGRCLLHLPVHDPDPLLLRMATLPDEILGASQLNQIETILSLTLGQTQWNRIVEELLTLHARIDGTRWKPLQPMIDGRMRIYLGGLLSEWLPGSVGASISENWNCADSPTSLNCQLPWTQLEGTGWGIAGNLARMTTGTATQQPARADSDLATADHETQVTLANAPTTTGHMALLARKDNTATLTYYIWLAGETGPRFHLYKRVAGTFTSLAIHAQVPVVNDVLLLRCNGSTISGRTNAIELVSVTDSAITGNLRCGISAQDDTINTPHDVDVWSAADLVQGGGAADIWRWRCSCLTVRKDSGAAGTQIWIVGAYPTWPDDVGIRDPSRDARVGYDSRDS